MSNSRRARTLSDVNRFFDLWAEIHDLGSCLELLEWDQETFMPEGAHRARGQLLAGLSGLRHRLLTSPELADTLEHCDTVAEPEGELAAQVREARRAVERARRLPNRLARDLAAASSAGIAAWREAREADRFALFAPALERLVSLKREEAMTLADGGDPYDALLDEYEPGLSAAELEALFEELAPPLSELVARVRRSATTIDESACRGSFPVNRQLAFGRSVAERIGFDFGRGRLDPSRHPFCIGLSRDDVRLTWRGREDDFRPGFFGILHEAGHGLYEQGLPQAWERTPLGAAASLGLHESQSRFWESQIGRSRAFWQAVGPELDRHFPDHRRGAAARLWPALHVVRPGLVRVDADETTYILHIVVRFDLERALLSGDLAIAELPGAWADSYERLLGVRPTSDREGALQDIHWASGLLGYFPTYALGTLLAAQLREACDRDVGPLDEALAAGELSLPLDWLRQRVHRWGSRLRPKEIVVRATGSPIGTAAFLDGVSRTATELYRL